MLKILILVVFSFSLQAKTFEINKDHSHISYKIPYMTFSDSEGSFTRYKGKVEFDPEKNTLTSLSAVIDTDSIETQDIKRNAHLRKSDFFHVKKYPQMTFTSAKITKTGPNLFQVTGPLTLKGVTRNVDLKIEFKGQRKDHIGKQSLFFKGSTEINRKDFNIRWNKSLDETSYLLGDVVRIDLTLQLQPLGKATSFAAHMIPSNKPIEDYARFKRGEIPKPQHFREITGEASAPIPVERPAPTKEKAHDSSPYTLTQILVGFLGFCLAIAASYYVKLKIMKLFKVDDYSEGSMPSLLGDFAVIAVVFIYAYFYYNYLYP